MQSILVSPLIKKDNIIDIEKYNSLNNVNEYILFGDNILEGITLLNDMVEDSSYLKFKNIVYQPIDQPIYIFEDKKNNLYSIKICGAYDKWKLPKEVSKIIGFVDLPDYIIYSVKSKKVLLAGENTETASVGNSQWQREGRKLGAAKIGVPFIYQTFYSGRDESQNTIREPNSLQVYNHIVYSVRYKTPSFVAYFENNFENSQTRERTPVDSKSLFSKYLKETLIFDVDKTTYTRKRQLEKELYIHMINYLKETKFCDINRKNQIPRLQKDLPVLNNEVLEFLLNNTEKFVEELLDYIYETSKTKISKYLSESKVLNFDKNKFSKWTSYNKKQNISDIINFLIENNKTPSSYIKRSSKIGFVDTKLCKEFLNNKFPDRKEEITKKMDETKYKESILIPLRIHKLSNGNLTFSPDPESGEIVAFSELFGYDLYNKKTRPIIGYCIVDTPTKFDINDKKGTKLYKALAEYIDILIIDNDKFIPNLPNEITYSNYDIESLISVKPTALTEEMAVVATYLNQTTIKSNWLLCFIHTHHSSWQQLVIYKEDEEIQEKIDRVSTKIDLITQKDNIFMLAEGKNNFQDILKDGKIQKAIEWSSKKIDKLYKNKNFQFDAFIYNLETIPSKDPEFFANREVGTVSESIKLGHFDDIAFHENFVIIIVYLDENRKTKFKLVYSPKFNTSMKNILDMEFEQ